MRVVPSVMMAVLRSPIRCNVYPCRSGRFGYEYFEKLSTATVKELLVEQVPAEEAADVANDGPPERSELGVITLGVNEV